MRYKLYWGLGILIVLLIGAFTFVMVNHHAENQKLKDQLEEAQELADQIEERKAAENNPPVARDGFKMVPHGDHWHEVPIDAPDVWEEQTPEPNVMVKNLPNSEKVEPKTFDTILTYDEELLRTNPVEALRREAEARGHWSAKYIPAFPPDDLEAQTYARAMFYTAFLPHDDPRWHEGIKNAIIFMDENIMGNDSKRAYDLLRIEWVDRDVKTPRAQLFDMGLAENTDYPIKH